MKGIYNDKEKHEAYDNWHICDNEDARACLDALSKVAKELGVRNNNLVLAWLMHDTRMIPIIGFSKKEQYLENMESAKIQLTEEQMRFLNSALA